MLTTLGVIIVALLAVLIFYNPAKAPQLPPDNVGGAKIIQPVVSADGHLSVTAPQAGALITSPATIVGTVTGGGWFFEASFPVKIVDGDGTVLGTGNTDAIKGCYSFGRWVLIQHDNGLSTIYAHLATMLVSKGDAVSTGQLIGYSDTTGYAVGPHLHFERGPQSARGPRG